MNLKLRGNLLQKMKRNHQTICSLSICDEILLTKMLTWRAAMRFLIGWVFARTIGAPSVKLGFFNSFFCWSFLKGLRGSLDLEALPFFDSLGFEGVFHSLGFIIVGDHFVTKEEKVLFEFCDLFASDWMLTEFISLDFFFTNLTDDNHICMLFCLLFLV